EFGPEIHVAVMRTSLAACSLRCTCGGVAARIQRVPVIMHKLGRRAAVAVAAILNVVIAGAHGDDDPKHSGFFADLAPRECGNIFGDQGPRELYSAGAVWLA